MTKWGKACRTDGQEGMGEQKTNFGTNDGRGLGGRSGPRQDDALAVEFFRDGRGGAPFELG